MKKHNPVFGILRLDDNYSVYAGDIDFSRSLIQEILKG